MQLGLLKLMCYRDR